MWMGRGFALRGSDICKPIRDLCEMTQLFREGTNPRVAMRRGRESNPRIAVLQTATLPLGYPAIFTSEKAIFLYENSHLSAATIVTHKNG